MEGHKTTFFLLPLRVGFPIWVLAWVLGKIDLNRSYVEVVQEIGTLIMKKSIQ